MSSPRVGVTASCPVTEMMGWQCHQLDHMQIICTSLQTDNHVSTSPLSFFTGQMPFLTPNQQCQSTEGMLRYGTLTINNQINKVIWSMTNLVIFTHSICDILKDGWTVVFTRFESLTCLVSSGHFTHHVATTLMCCGTAFVHFVNMTLRVG